MNEILRLEKNARGRDFVCGDIHGCFDDLETGLGEKKFNPSADRLFCVGDLFDRGPRSQDALEYYRKDWLYTVKGNHEDMFAQLYEQCGSAYARYRFVNGADRYGNGNEWMAPQKAEYLQEMFEAVRLLPLIIQIGDTLILHARLPPVNSLEEIEAHSEKYEETILWERKGRPKNIRITGINRVFCGHTIVKNPVEYKGTINIDTGAFLAYWKGYSGRLTILPLFP
ncbi:MAG: metallophosphoesterase [Spirochaetaceae bacterium]|jgi:serine/threonine protein phosphatase 1|nr:metallophosphoesterase [Spirochaetaceae bacterium]